MQADLKQEMHHRVRIGCSMKYTHKRKPVCGLATLCYFFCFVLKRSFEGGTLCKLPSRLLVAAGGILWESGLVLDQQIRV